MFDDEGTDEEKRERLISLLKTHDWTYQYSDDYSAFEQGREVQRRIDWLVNQLPGGRELYDTYKPKGL